MAIDYCQRVWDSKLDKWVGIKISDMSVNEADFWDAKIQPEIRRIAMKEISEGAPLTRPDYKWPWGRMRRGLPLAQGLVGRRCRMLTLSLKSDAGKAVPAGMLILIEKYPWLLQNGRLFRFGFAKESTFLWFLSSAPKDALQAQGVRETPSLIRALIDSALVTSISQGLKGRMWLHAAPQGGVKLFDTYANRCKLKNVEPGAKIPRIPRPFSGVSSDGRHFYATPGLARRLIDELKEWRRI